MNPCSMPMARSSISDRRAVIRLVAAIGLSLLAAAPAAAQSRSAAQGSDMARAVGAQRRAEVFLETQRILRDYADALKVPDHIRTYCAMDLADRVAERRRADRDHPLFADRDAFFATEAGETTLRRRQAYELAHQQLCLAGAMRTLEGFPPLARP